MIKTGLTASVIVSQVSSDRKSMMLLHVGGAIFGSD